MIQPTFNEFCRFAKHGNLVPVYQELLMDLETPLSFFKRLERDRYSFLLESVEGSERWARYSFWALDRIAFSAPAESKSRLSRTANPSPSSQILRLMFCKSFLKASSP